MIHELVKLPGAASLTCGQWNQTAFPFSWHQHPEIELTLILAGRGTRHVADDVSEFAEHDVCLLGAGTPHTWHSLPTGTPVTSVCIQFSADAITQAANSLPELGGLHRLFSRARRGLQAEGVLGQQMMEAIREVHAQKSPLARLGQLLRALSLLEDGSRCRALSSVGYQGEPQDPTILRLTRFVHEHRHQPISQRRAAAVVGVSEAGFSRFFKSRFNRTWRSYLVELRIADACRLLAEGEDSVMNIAMACGFGNLANFNRRFRQVKLTTPSEWRHKARGG